MKKGLKVILVIASFSIVIAMIISNYTLENRKRGEFRMLEARVQGFADTTSDRVAKAVVTLPDGDKVVGLNNNKGDVVEIQNRYLKTEFIPGIYNRKDPRLDAIVPMYVNADSNGNSMYIVLFNDRGDVVLEKSHARLGNQTVIIDSISTLPADPNIAGEEYRVKVIYKLQGLKSKDSNQIVSIPKEVTIPVIGGYFDPSRTISK